jgi:intein-encoded DNA endonuclease-like protein
MKGDGSQVAYMVDSKDETRLQVRDRDFAEHFNVAVSKVLEKERPNKIMTVIRKERNNAVFYHSKHSSLQLGEVLRRSLTDLKGLIETHPEEFLRGFFDSEGSASPNFSSRNLHMRVIASNTNVETLTYVRELLAEKFGILSSIYDGRKAGESSLVYGNLVTRTKDSFFLVISRSQSVQRFFSRIGFSMTRKNETLRDGLGLIAVYGGRAAALKWQEMYMKNGRRWTKPSQSSSVKPSEMNLEGDSGCLSQGP